jgi:TfoX/Sxy family transcriptional regulator of competence genes
MPYDEGLSERIRDILAEHTGVTEKKKFGGLAFLLNGNMFCGVTNADLMLRLGADEAKAAIDQLSARAMDFTGRPLKGFVYVGPDGYAEDDALSDWIMRAIRFAESLPAK